MRLPQGKSELTFDESKLTIGEGNTPPTEAKLSVTESKSLFHRVIRYFNRGLAMMLHSPAELKDRSVVFGRRDFRNAVLTACSCQLRGLPPDQRPNHQPHPSRAEADTNGGAERDARFSEFRDVAI